MRRIERVDLAVYSRQLRRQAVWCGLVFSLAALFAILNLLPPVQVQYEVTGEILVDPSRVQGLVRNVKQSTTRSEPVVLRDFQVLARSHSDRLPEVTRFHGNDRVFLMLKSRWQRQCTVGDFNDWANSVTQLDAEVHRDSDMASQTRMARWELTAAEHYRKHHDFLASNSLLPESLESGQPVDKTAGQSAGDSTKFQFAGLEGKSTTGHLVASVTDEDAIKEATDSNVSHARPTNQAQDFTHQKQLEANVALAQQRLLNLESSISQAVDKLSGKIELLDVPQVVPISDRIPTWMAVSIFVILATTGSLAGAFYFRLQSGGVYDPQEVAQQLVSQGLPVVATVQLPSDELDSTDWLELAGRQASGAGRKTAKNLTLLSEAVVTVWCVAILARFLFDPLWRQVLIDNPLAAFSRLIAGLP